MFDMVWVSVSPVEIDGVVVVKHLEETGTNLGRLHVGKVVGFVADALEYPGHFSRIEVGEECRAADNVES